jgi:hypothetical protein
MGLSVGFSGTPTPPTPADFRALLSVGWFGSARTVPLGR